jgi:hypothetical protein
MLALGVEIEEIARLAVGAQDQAMRIEQHGGIGQSGDQRPQRILSGSPFSQVKGGGGSPIVVFPGPDHKLGKADHLSATFSPAYDKFLTNQKERHEIGLRETTSLPQAVLED